MPVRPRMTPKCGPCERRCSRPWGWRSCRRLPRRRSRRPAARAPRYRCRAAKLAAALNCVGTLRGAAHAPVLLVPGTALNPATDYGYGWEPALSKLGWPYCTVTLPGNGMGDIQVAGEYVVYAIRTMHAAYGGRIDIVGHSPGRDGPPLGAALLA